MTPSETAGECETCREVDTFISYNHKNGKQTTDILFEDWGADIKAHHAALADLKRRAERAEAALSKLTKSLESWGHGMDCPAQDDDNEAINAECDCGANAMLEARDEARRILQGSASAKGRGQG